MTLTSVVMAPSTPEEMILLRTRVDADEPITQILEEDFGRWSMRQMININEILDRILFDGEDIPLKEIEPVWCYYKVTTF